MTWTYNLAALSSTPLFQVRFLIGDTDTTRQLVQDEEILYVLTTYTDPRAAAAVICEAIAAKLSQEADARAGDLSESSSQKAKAFADRAKELRSQLSTTALPVFGGIRFSQKEPLDEDSDLVPPSFRIGENEHPELAADRSSPEWWR